jgi:thiamine transport system permease protein
VSRSRAALAVGPLLFLAVLFAWPLGRVLALGLAGAEGGPLGPVLAVLADARMRDAVWFTLWQAVASTVLTLAVGLPVAAVLSTLEFRGRRAIEAAVLVPFVLPTVVVGAAFVALLGALPGGVPQRGVVPILLAHVFFNVSVVVRTVGGTWQHLDRSPALAARGLGAGPLRAFAVATLPRLRPAIASAAVVVFLFTFTSFGVVLVLGGSGAATLEVEIHRATTRFLDLGTAAALSVLQLTAVAATLGVYGRLRRRSGPERLRRAGAARRPPRTTAERAAVAGAIAVLAVLQGAPLVALLLRSLRVGDGWGLAHYRGLDAPTRAAVLSVAPVEALANSVAIALAATAIAMVLGLAAAVAAAGGSRLARLADGALMLPLGTSAVTLGLGLLLTFRTGPLAGRGSVLLVPLAQALIATPFVVRTVLPVLRGIDDRLREAVATLGATPRRVRREVDLPIVSRAGLVAAGFAFAIAVGEFGATVFVARASNPTVPVAIERALGLPGAVNLGRALALSVLLAALTGLVVLLVDRVRVGAVGRF